MSLTIKTDSPPLYKDQYGAVRVGKSRVLLEMIIRAFQDGASPEICIQRYPAVTLSDAYAVIGYYLRHRQEVDSYLAAREQSAQQLQRCIENHQQNMGDIRARLLAGLSG